MRVLSQRLHQYLLPITRNFHGAGLTEMAQSARIEPLGDGQTIIGTITLIEDVTERVISERELRNQIAASDQARQIAEEASRLKDEFLATLSHEIRTPLNAVIGWTRILQTQPSVRSRAHALDVIERNAMAQMRLVEDLLDMARIISGKLRLNIDTVSIEAVAQAAVDVVTPGAVAKRIAVETSFGEGLPAVSGDSERLQQVVWNLLSNALKFTERGSIRFAVSALPAWASTHVRYMTACSPSFVAAPTTALKPDPSGGWQATPRSSSRRVTEAWAWRWVDVAFCTTTITNTTPMAACSNS